MLGGADPLAQIRPAQSGVLPQRLDDRPERPQTVRALGLAARTRPHRAVRHHRQPAARMPRRTHRARPRLRIVTCAVQFVTAYAVAAYAVPAWSKGASGRQVEPTTAPSAPQRPVTVSMFSQRFSSTSARRPPRPAPRPRPAAHLGHPARHPTLRRRRHDRRRAGGQRRDPRPRTGPRLRTAPDAHPGRPAAHGGVRHPRRTPAAGTADLAPAPSPLGEAGRGLFLVDALADRWEVLDRVSPGVALPGKTVRAEPDLPSG